MKFVLAPNYSGGTDKQLLDDLRQVAKKAGRHTLRRDEYTKLGRFTASELRRRFGTWSICLQRAGLKHTPKSSEITDKQLFDNLERVWRSVGGQPAMNDMRKAISDYGKELYTKRWGSWQNSLMAFVDFKNQRGHGNRRSKGRLKHLQKVRKHTTKREPSRELRAAVLKRDKYRCVNCGKSSAKGHDGELQIDHIKPWAKGGETVMKNLQTLCKKCNSKKRAR
jgi:5-methylcytosine-specific restriction endonuclease McrA